MVHYTDCEKLQIAVKFIVPYLEISEMTFQQSV